MSLTHASKEIRLTAPGPSNTASLSAIYRLSPDTETTNGEYDSDPTNRALTAETRDLMVRMTNAIAWGNKNLDSDIQPKAGAAFYRIDSYIRSLLDRYHLSASPGESDLSLTLRALATEFGHIAYRAKAVVQATANTAADTSHTPGPSRAGSA